MFRERGREGKRKEEKHQCASPTTPTGVLSCNSGVCPDWELNQQPFGSQAGIQSTELHQPGLIFFVFRKLFWMLVIEIKKKIFCFLLFFPLSVLSP